MVARFLVTTSLEETWPDKHTPVLFLGEWCLLYARKSSWKNFDAEVAPYHWDDRQKLKNDYQELRKIYEEALQNLAIKLNKLHDVEFSIRYWRILVGPWLAYFIQITFDRWFMIDDTIAKNELIGVNAINREEQCLVANDMLEFEGLITSDDWNESIYAQICEMKNFPVNRIERKNSNANNLFKDNKLTILKKIRKSAGKINNYLMGMLSREDNAFLKSDLMSFSDSLIMQTKLRQFPNRWATVPCPSSQYDAGIRNWKLEFSNKESEFHCFLTKMIPKHIPVVYLEGFKSLINTAHKLPWPKRPKFIYTCISHSADDVFKAWAANQTESGTPLVIGQHGGNYGMALWSFYEEHEIAISDQYITWGWSDADEKKITPVGNLKFPTRTFEAKKNGYALLVGLTLPRQSYHMYSVPVSSGQMNCYFEDQYRFVNALPSRLRSEILVRLSPQDYKYSQKKRWNDRFPELSIEQGKKPMKYLLDGTKLFISTYNATTYLESLSHNIPTIIFWDKNYWEIRKEAVDYFELLKSVGIFHESPESAAKQVQLIWDDVPAWWNSTQVQLARNQFCMRFTLTSKDRFGFFVSVFKDIIRKKYEQVIN